MSRCVLLKMAQELKPVRLKVNLTDLAICCNVCRPTMRRTTFDPFIDSPTEHHRINRTTCSGAADSTVNPPSACGGRVAEPPSSASSARSARSVRRGLSVLWRLSKERSNKHHVSKQHVNIMRRIIDLMIASHVC